MADNYNAGQAGHYFSDEEIDELIEPFTKYTKKKNRKPPGGGQGRPSSGTPDTTELFKWNEKLPGFNVQTKKENGETLYKPTFNSWLSLKTGEDYDFMTRQELIKTAENVLRKDKRYEDIVSPITPNEVPADENWDPDKLVPMSKVEEVVDDPELLSLLKSIASRHGDPNKIENYTLGTFGVRVE